MNFDLTNKEDRKRFVRRANKLLAKKRTKVSLVDESGRTLSQNSYIHVLCRILASDTGVTESYAKQVYFKDIANSDIFVRITKDPITNQMIKTFRSTTELTIPEMRKAITNFRNWAAEHNYYLPEAKIADDGTYTFASEYDMKAFHQAWVQTSKSEDYL